VITLLPSLRPFAELTTATDLIDKNTHEVRQDEDKVVYKSLEEIGDDLPDHSPRFVLLSYPLTLVRLLRRDVHLSCGPITDIVAA
jgi:hypothetical protein